MAVDQDTLQRSVQQLLARIDAVGRDGSRPLSEGLTAVIDTAGRVLGVDCVGVLLLDEDEQLRTVASSDPIAAALEQAQQNLAVGPGVDSVRTATTVAIDDLRTVEAYRELADEVEQLGVRAVVSAPVWVNGAVAGNLNAMRLGSHDWAPDEVAAVETYADVIAALLQISVGPDRMRRSEGAAGARS